MRSRKKMWRKSWIWNIRTRKCWTWRWRTRKWMEKEEAVRAWARTRVKTRVWTRTRVRARTSRTSYLRKYNRFQCYCCWSISIIWSTPRCESRDDCWLEIKNNNQEKGILFFVANVLALNQQASENETTKVLWYQSKMPIGLHDEEGYFHNWYTNCIHQGWEPSREENTCIIIDSIFTGRYNTTKWCTLSSIRGIWIEKELKIPNNKMFHFQFHLNSIEY